MYRLRHLNLRQRIRQHCSGYYHGLHARVRSAEIEIVASEKSGGGGDVWNGPGVSQRSPPCQSPLFVMLNHIAGRLTAVGIVRVIVFFANDSTENPTCEYTTTICSDVESQH